MDYLSRVMEANHQETPTTGDVDGHPFPSKTSSITFLQEEIS